MKITFPHLGNVYVIAKALLDDLGQEYVIPPFNNKTALEIGTKYAPELACLPLKINIGNFVQACRMGADTILMTGGCGPCRFGYYCEMHREILQGAGYNMDVITLEAPNGDIKEFLSRISRLAGGIKPVKIINVIRNATQISLMVDEMEKLSFRTRPRELLKGETDRICTCFRETVLRTEGSGKIKKLIEDTCDRLRGVKVDNELKPLKIGIVGEIYTTIDSVTSFNIQEKLGNMGVEVRRDVTLSGWIVEHMLKKALHLPRDLRFVDAARPYLGAMIGGHAQETIGNTVLYAREGFDGIIQIYPFSCMPEIVAQSILPAIEKDYDIPFMTLIIDEMTGEAGYLTRVEAYIDLLGRRRENKAVGKRNNGVLEQGI